MAVLRTCRKTRLVVSQSIMARRSRRPFLLKLLCPRCYNSNSVWVMLARFCSSALFECLSKLVELMALFRSPSFPASLSSGKTTGPKSGTRKCGPRLPRGTKTAIPVSTCSSYCLLALVASHLGDACMQRGYASDLLRVAVFSDRPF